jgi:hypothetical protein
VLILAASDGASSSSGALAVIALGIAILSLLIATAALGWQIAAWLLEAGRARVKLRMGGIGRGGALISQAVAGRDFDGAAAIQQAAREGFTVPVLAVRVTSTGRAPVTVQQWMVKGQNTGFGVSGFGDSVIGPPLPKRL